MTWEQALAMISIVISLIGVGVSLYNSSKQRQIDEKLQNNEFKYSRRKIWYDNQSKAIEEILEVLSRINKQLTDFKESFNLQYGSEQEFLRYALVDGDRLIKLNHLKQVYFDEEMSKLTNQYITILDELSDKSFKYIMSEKEEDLNQE